MRPLVFIVTVFLFIYACSPRTTAPSKPSAKSESYRMHEVKAGETFATIASKNSVTTQQLKNANPGIREPLKAGQTIKIPLKTTTTGETTIRPDTVKPPVKPGDLRKEKYKIALLLPFKTQLDDELQEDIDASTRVILEFYEGALIAFDSLQSLGLKAEVHAIDTDRDENEVNKFLNSPLAKEADIIIGPAYASKIGIVEEFCRKNNKYFVSPISSSPDVTTNNSLGTQFTPSVPTQVDLASKYIVENFRNVNAVIAHKDFVRDTDLKNMFMGSLKKHGAEDVYSVIFDNAGNEQLKMKLLPGRQNFVIIPSSDEAFVAEVFSDLIVYAGEFEIAVMGLPTWEGFETIDFGKLQNVQTYFFSTSQINYENYHTKAVRKKFINRWKTDPSAMGYQGYDVAFIFGKMLLEHGLNFQSQLPKMIYQPTQNGINWQKSGEDGGYENQYVAILRYKDYELRKLNK